ncbi:helix-turn-helix domain-containing protein [Thiomonas sp. FB-6]|uniref:AlbA family DNA-binding domain-containing protein n=1 Tax=Thiomonas sp. FB-6 TaxID=1158291 RepID=UPI0003A4C53F|nr:ATP-binding protein [Thiomonas sp. FB-6]
MTLPVRLVDTTQEHLEQLVREHAQEGPHLEFKRDFPTNWDTATKTEVLADITALANASGGDLLYGIAEGGSAQAEALVPQVLTNVDQEVRRLQDFLLHLVEPRMPGVQVHAVPVSVAGTAGHVVLVRVPQSWVGPHRVNTNQHFFIRDGLRKRPLNVPEIRGLFLRSENMAQRVRDFRTDRLAKVLTGEVPFRLTHSTVLVLHIVPVDAVLGAVDVNPVQYLGLRRGIPVVASRSAAADALVNLDGVAGARSLVEDGTNGYTLLFRNGFIETTWALSSNTPEMQAVLPGGSYEDYIAQFVAAARAELRDWGLSEQVIAMLSILDARKVTLGFQHGWGDSQLGNFDRDVLALPDVELSGESDVRTELKPLFDLVWQSAGFAASPHYDSSGNWAPQRT